MTPWGAVSYRLLVVANATSTSREWDRRPSAVPDANSDPAWPEEPAEPANSVDSLVRTGGRIAWAHGWPGLPGQTSRIVSASTPSSGRWSMVLEQAAEPFLALDGAVRRNLASVDRLVSDALMVVLRVEVLLGFPQTAWEVALADWD